MITPPSEQLAKLRADARWSWLPNGLVVLTLVSLTASYLTDHNAVFVLSLCAGFFAVAAKQTEPHYRNAIKALDQGRPILGTVAIKVFTWDDGLEYQAWVETAGLGVWRFAFQPQRFWMPQAGYFDATVFTLSNVAWPVLVFTQQGLLFPADKPSRR
jgi:hypothetical protein